MGMSNKETTRIVKCTRCRNQHEFTERFWEKNKNGYSKDSICPRCGSKVYYLIENNNRK